MRTLPAVVCLLLLVSGTASGADDEADEDLRPGLLAHYTTLADHAPAQPALTLDRIEPVPRLFGQLGPGSHHPLTKQGFSIRWSGRLEVPYPGNFTLTALGSSLAELRVEINGQPIELGRPIELAAGNLPLAIEGKHDAGQADPSDKLSFELWWRSDFFPDEPIPSQSFHHDPSQVAEDLVNRQRRVEQGAILSEEFGCFRCHSGDKLASPPRAAAGGDPGPLPGPRLDGLSRRVQQPWLAAWLKDPHASKADARMPALFGASAADDLALRTIALYLTSKRPGEQPAVTADRAKGETLYRTLGCAACHGPQTPEGHPDDEITSRVPTLERLAAKWTAEGLREFLEKPLETRPHGRMPDFGLSGDDAADLTAYLLSLGSTPPAPHGMPTVTDEELQTQWNQLVGKDTAPLPAARDSRLAAVALRQMAAKNCFACHELHAAGALTVDRTHAGSLAIAFADQPQPAAAHKFSDLASSAVKNPRAGCLSPDAKWGEVPSFPLDPHEREAIEAYLLSEGRLAWPSSRERLRVDLALHNCARCHENDGRGGEPLRALLGNPELAKYAAAPPLSRVAERVRPERLEQWITQGARQQALRPWTGAHMPGFGSGASTIAQALIERDHATQDHATDPATAKSDAVPQLPQPEVQPEHLQLGRFLVGTRGLACVNCHPLHGKMLAGQPDPTARGPELDRLAAHLRPAYFYRWIMSPARIRPGTKMPQAIQASGKVALPALASLPPGAAMNALWTYLNQGSEASAPANEPMLLAVPTPSQPVVQRGDTAFEEARRFPRGLAIGFVEGTILFDADQLSPAAVWYGSFVKSAAQPYFGLSWNRETTDQPTSEVLIPANTCPLCFKLAATDAWQDFELPLACDPNDGTRFEGYQVGKSTVRLKYRLQVGGAKVSVAEDVALESRPDWKGYVRQFRLSGLPEGSSVAIALPHGADYRMESSTGEPVPETADVGRAPFMSLSQGPLTYTLRAQAPPGSTWTAFAANYWRLVAPAAAQGEPTQVRIDCWRYGGQAMRPTPAELASLAAQPTALEDFSRAPGEHSTPVAAGAATQANARVEPLPSAAASAAHKRPAVSPEQNVDEFAPVRAKFLRFSVSATLNGQPSIDELEVFGADEQLNLAAAAKATASTELDPAHSAARMIDGQFGDKNAWAGTKRDQGWAQLEFAEPVEVRKVIWSRDRTGLLKDRLAIGYTIEVSADANHWTKVSDDTDRAPLLGPGVVDPNASPGYTIEAIPAPFEGCRPSDVAFDERGRLYALAMTEGQVWRTKNPPPEAPQRVDWQRYAVGLNHPIGLAVVDGRVFVSQKPEITELLDQDNDGVADLYRTVASGWGLSSGFHEYTFGLAVDRDKNLWFALNTGFFWTNPGYVNPGRYRGSILRVSYPAERLEVVATGCRVPNGIAGGPGDDMFYTDNQGDWIQSCKLAHIVPGRFYGHPEHKEDALAKDVYPSGPSAIWLPYDLSRSTSGPAHDDTRGKFGPFADQMFVGDVGYGANPGIMRIALEKVDGEYQGACIPFVDNQPHGCLRMKFGPDDQLYMASLTTGITRMRFTGPLPFALRTINIRPGGTGFDLKLTQPLATAGDPAPDTFRVKRYHYLYTGNYGSPQADETIVPVQRAEVSGDRKEITLTLPIETYPIGMVYEIDAGKLTSAQGDKLQHHRAWYTVQRIPK